LSNRRPRHQTARVGAALLKLSHLWGPNLES
jgi:hypothetical protein